MDKNEVINENEVINADEIKRRADRNEKIKFVLWCIVIILAACIVRKIFKPTLIVGTSMEPTYTENQFVIGHMCLNIDRFDVVTIQQDDKLLIKRVIGLPGDTIEFYDNVLYINGVPTEDPYATGITSDFSTVVSDGHYFCMGDNREHSYDSRYYGEFSLEQIDYKINWS